MSLLIARLDKLSKAPVAAQVDILCEALAHAEPGERVPLAVRLLALHSSRGVAEAIRILAMHPELKRPLLDLPRTELAVGMRRLVSTGQPQGIARCIELATESPDPVIAAELIPVLAGREESLRPAAAAAIVLGTAAAVGAAGRRTLSSSQHEQIDRMIAAALDSFELHRCEDILLAAALVHRLDMPEVRRRLDADGTPVRLALHGTVRRLDHPIVQRNLVAWLQSPLLGRQAARLLARIADLTVLAEILQSSHLLLAPGRRRNLRHADHATRCLVDLATAVQLPSAAQNALPRFAAALPITAARRASYLADGIALPSPIARWRACEQLAGHRHHDARRSLRQFLRDREAVVAGVAAAIELSDALPSDESLDTISRSSHALQAGRARAQLACRSVDQLRRHLSALSRPVMLVAARHALAAQPLAFIETLRCMLDAQDRFTCLSAIAAARRLRLVNHVETQLIDLTAVDDPQVSSAAVTAVADVPGSRPPAVIETLLRHRHPRVRANAIDALSAVAGRQPTARDRLVEVILPHTLSRQNRERANALRAWIAHASPPDQSPPDRCVQALRDMLHDANPMHRISAIWVAGRSRQPRLADDLREVMSVEATEPVRRRAAAALRRVTGTADLVAA